MYYLCWSCAYLSRLNFVTSAAPRAGGGHGTGDSDPGPAKLKTARSPRDQELLRLRASKTRAGELLIQRHLFRH